MAREIQVPCDGEGVCMRCKVKPPPAESLTCGMCVTPWHMACLHPESLDSAAGMWHCPDCSGVIDPAPVSGMSGVESSSSVLVAAIRAIENDETLTEEQKARKRQRLVSGQTGEEEEKGGDDVVDDEVLAAFKESLMCSICIQLPERPVTTPCGHNFCLKCFEKWIGQGKNSCVKCRANIPKKMSNNPRINSSIVAAIRVARVSKCVSLDDTAKVYHCLRNQDRPDKAFTTERAKKTGKANACSGKIMVSIPHDHFGPIPAENDPTRNQGVLVGESWEDRQECRQWGAHFPHVAGIAGQKGYGAQSVALSGGYLDDEDHGEWFLYTGSGGRDLSGNKRTNKVQSSDQKFDKSNEALKISCKNGYPVRVVRSHKEKRSAYAPSEKVVRYDGVYRIEKCWRKIGMQGKFKVCRYLFVRCDNEPAPWTSDEHGDCPRPIPNIPELKKATDLFERQDTPSWDFDATEGRWKWAKSPPPSQKVVTFILNPEEKKLAKQAMKKTKNSTMRDRLLKEFRCQLCKKVMNLPVTTPCAHNFCKGCLEAKYVGKTQVTERSRGGRTLRARKNVMKCPCCPNDISDFLDNPEVNREVMALIEKLQKKEEAEPSGGSNIGSEEQPAPKKMKLADGTAAAV